MPDTETVALADICEWLDAHDGRLVGIEWRQERGKWIAVATWCKKPPIA